MSDPHHGPPSARPDAVQALLDRPRFGTGLGLARARTALRHLGAALPPAIAITGSNGKGSVTHMVASILRAAGLRVGTFISPHLIDPRERIAIDTTPIDVPALTASLAWLEHLEARHAQRRPNDHRGAFESWFAVAMHHFSRTQPDVVVAEAGIGGRLDPTRALRAQTCALVSVDLEHTALLGPTRTAIAFDKADLCPRGGNLIVGPIDDEVGDRLGAYATIRGIARLDAPTAAHRARTADGTRFELALPDLPPLTVDLGVHGRHQVDNAAVAARTALHWLRTSPRAYSGHQLATAIADGLRRVRLVGRMECIAREPTVFIDVGHTPAALQHVADTLRDHRPRPGHVLVAGVSEDRSPAALLPPVLEHATAVIATTATTRGGDPDRITTFVGRSHPTMPCSVAPTVAEALDHACTIARRQGVPVLVAGGLFTAMEARATRLPPSQTSP